jgi:hypothetical protein
MAAAATQHVPVALPAACKLSQPQRMMLHCLQSSLQNTQLLLLCSNNVLGHCAAVTLGRRAGFLMLPAALLRVVCCMQHVIQLAKAKGIKTINVIRDRCANSGGNLCCFQSVLHFSAAFKLSVWVYAALYGSIPAPIPCQAFHTL